jgi:hypothetical protein
VANQPFRALAVGGFVGVVCLLGLKVLNFLPPLAVFAFAMFFGFLFDFVLRRRRTT